MKRTCWTTGSWRSCLSLEVVSSIPAWSTIIYRFLCGFICVSLCQSIKIKPTNMYICMYSLLPEINRPTKETTNSPTLIDNISREDRFVTTKIYAQNSMPSFQIKLREIDYSSISSATNLNRFLRCSIISAKVHIIPVFHSGKLNQFTESVNDVCQLALNSYQT